jgi:hypothetical protein
MFVSPPASLALLSRLRASTRLIALVLVVFLLKIGMVAACASHDFNDAAVTAAEQSPAKTPLQADIDDGGKPVEPKASGDCVDCHCHHVATLIADFVPRMTIAPTAQPPGAVVSARTVIPALELRPPIV